MGMGLAGMVVGMGLVGMVAKREEGMCSLEGLMVEED